MSEALHVHLAPTVINGKPSRHHRYTATLDGEELVSNARDPEHDVCRLLVGRGYGGPVQFYMLGTPSMRMNAGKAATKYVSETSTEGPYLRKWAPSPFPG